MKASNCTRVFTFSLLHICYGYFPSLYRFRSLCCGECSDVNMCKKSPVLLTQSSQPRRSNQLHQLVVAHISQQVLQASLSSQRREFVAAAAAASCRSGNGRVVQVLVHLTTVLVVLVGLWLLLEMRKERIP